MRLSDGHSLLRPAIEVGRAPYHHAAFGVFHGFQVTNFDCFLRFFVCHFILLSRWFGLPGTLVLRIHFWPYTEIVRKIEGEVTQKAMGQRSPKGQHSDCGIPSVPAALYI